MFSEEVSEQICENIIDDYQKRGNNEVDEALHDVVTNQPRGSAAEKGGQDYPAEESELVFEKTLL